MRDGGLVKLLRANLPTVHWQAIETWSTGQGVPDANGCHQGAEFWVECKLATGYVVPLRAEQVAWLERRTRAGGRTFIMVRQQAPAGPRRGPKIDHLWLFPGSMARDLFTRACTLQPEYSHLALGCWAGGPAKWPWQVILKTLVRPIP